MPSGHDTDMAYSIAPGTRKVGSCGWGTSR